MEDDHKFKGLWILEGYLIIENERGEIRTSQVFHVCDGVSYDNQNCIERMLPEEEAYRIAQALMDNGWTVNFWQIHEKLTNPRIRHQVRNRIKRYL